MSASIEYRIALDEAYLAAALRRTRELKPGGRRRRWTKWLIGPLFLGVGVMMLCAGAWWGGVAFAGMGTLVVIEDALNDALACRKFRKSPSFGSGLHLVLGERSCHVTDASSDQELDWRLFSRARAFEDGILLHSVEGHGRWLPNSATHSPTSRKRNGSRRCAPKPSR